MKTVTIFEGEETLISVENYKRALASMSLTEKQLQMLRAHYHAPDRRITMSELAEQVGFSRFSAANLHYGRLGRNLCKAMQTEPDDTYQDGSPLWLSILAEVWTNKDGESEFQMWSELAEALEQLDLV